jgi:hypothetical protein
MYYIYHIPNYTRKSGKIGKIGCTETPKERVEKQGYTNYEILETHTDIMVASNREIELQKQYGYTVDKIPYYNSRSKWGSVAGKIGGKIGGKIQGNKNVESGQLARIRLLGYKKGGMVSGKKNVESGHLAKISKLAIEVNKKPILQYTKSGLFIKEWECGKYASMQLNISQGNITSCLKGRYKSAGGYVWKYKQ